MLENLKSQAHNALTKIIMLSSSQEEKPNQIDEFRTRKFQQYIENQRDNLQKQQLAVLNLILANRLNQQATIDQFKQHLVQLRQQFKAEEQNQFAAELHIPTTSPKTPAVQQKPTKKSGNKLIIRTKKTEPSVQNNPEYFRIDHEVCHKLFELYRRCEVGMKDSPVSFEEKERYRQTMNYNKIMELLKDANVPLDVAQKLQILRSVKKFAFNQNFINKDEFIKIFKGIVHGLGVKQQQFSRLLTIKSHQSVNMKRPPSKQWARKRQHRYTKLKTQASILDSSTIPLAKRGLQQTKTPIRVQNAHQIDATQHSNGLQPTERRRISTLHSDENKDSYLIKAMERNKVTKITWESLFKMTEANKPNYISIPNFIRDGYDQD